MQPQRLYSTPAESESAIPLQAVFFLTRLYFIPGDVISSRESDSGCILGRICQQIPITDCLPISQSQQRTSTSSGLPISQNNQQTSSICPLTTSEPAQSACGMRDLPKKKQIKGGVDFSDLKCELHLRDNAQLLKILDISAKSAPMLFCRSELTEGICHPINELCIPNLIDRQTVLHCRPPRSIVMCVDRVRSADANGNLTDNHVVNHSGTEACVNSFTRRTC
jgi:hypothetical protein